MQETKRFTQIANVLMKEGMGYLIDILALRSHIPFVKNIHLFTAKKPKSLIPPQVRVRTAFESLGGAFVKLGQLLSLRPDLVPTKYCDEFRKLQDTVQPIPYADIAQVIEQEFGKKCSPIAKDPIGSASIAQVHTARYAGKDVVIKVQRPHAKKQFAGDIKIMETLAKRIDARMEHTTSTFSASRIVSEFKRYTKEELDFRIEAANIERFNKQAQFKHVRIPQVYAATENAIILEKLPGEKLSVILGSPALRTSYPRRVIAQQIVEMVMHQVFEMDVFHADLHPGNILIDNHTSRKHKKTKKEITIGLLDFGIVGGLSAPLRDQGLELYTALIARDAERVASILLRIGMRGNHTDEQLFRLDVQEIVNGYRHTQVGQTRITHILHELFDTCLVHGITIPADTILLGKSLVTAEATCALVDPDFDFADDCTNYLTLIAKNKMKTVFDKKNLLQKALDAQSALSYAAHQGMKMIDTLERGSFKIDIDDTDVKRLGMDIDRSSNRLSFALIVSALIIAGAVLYEVGPAISGIPLISTVLLVSAVLLFITFIISVYREGKYQPMR